MDEAGSVRRGEPASGGEEHREHVAPRMRGVEPRSERVAGDALHRDEHVIVVNADVVHGDDVRVAQASERLRLPPQAVGEVRSHLVRVEHLQRDVALELGVARDVHDSHATFAGAAAHDVTTDARAGCEVEGPVAGARLRVDREGRDRSPAGRARRDVRLQAPPRRLIGAPLGDRHQRLHAETSLGRRVLHRRGW